MKEQLKKAEERMNRRLDHLCTEYAEIRAGRANPAVLDKVKVDYYGAPTPVNQLAAVSVTEARTLTIQPWDASILRQIEKAIQKSDIGINPMNDGKPFSVRDLTVRGKKLTVTMKGRGSNATMTFNGRPCDGFVPYSAFDRDVNILEVEVR